MKPWPVLALTAPHTSGEKDLPSSNFDSHSVVISSIRKTDENWRNTDTVWFLRKEM